MYFRYFIQLTGDLLKGKIQIQGLHTNPISVHAIHLIGLNQSVGLGIEHHARNGTLRFAELVFAIFNIGEYLLEIIRMNRVFIEPNLGRICIIFRVNNQHRILSFEMNVALHHGKHVAVAVIQ